MTEVIFVAGRNCCGKTQLAYALWGCKRAADATHYEVTELLSGKVTVVTVTGCACARLYETDLGEKYLLVDGAPLGIAFLPAVVVVAAQVGAVELWIRGCYHRSLERSPFAQYPYPTSLRRVYFECVTDGDLAAEGSDGHLDLQAEALARRKGTVALLTKRSDRRVKTLRTRCVRRDRTEEGLQGARAALTTAKAELQRCIDQKQAIEAQLAAQSSTVTALTEEMLPPLIQIDVAQIVDDVITHPQVIAILPAVQALVSELLPLNRRIAARNQVVMQHIEQVSALERRVARSRTAGELQNDLQNELRKNVTLHQELEDPQ